MLGLTQRSSTSLGSTECTSLDSYSELAGSERLLGELTLSTSSARTTPFSNGLQTPVLDFYVHIGCVNELEPAAPLLVHNHNRLPFLAPPKRFGNLVRGGHRLLDDILLYPLRTVFVLAPARSFALRTLDTPVRTGSRAPRWTRPPHAVCRRRTRHSPHSPSANQPRLRSHAFG